MSKTTDYKMTKKHFEQMLFDINGRVPVGCAKVNEDGKTLYLYYGRLKDKHGLEEHIGTWVSGECWTFDDPIKRLKKGAK